MRRRRKYDESAEINVTPMLDIVFILLILFIVTTSFVRESGIEMNRSSNTPVGTEEAADAIFVRIESDGQILIGNRATDVRFVRANIQSSLAQMPDAAVVVAAARRSDAGLLVRVVDQARVAGATQVSMVEMVE